MHPPELFDTLPDHTLEHILTRLPLPSILATRRVCKRWHSLTTSTTFLSLYSDRQAQSESWLYVNGFRYNITSLTSSPSTTIPKLSPGSNHCWGAGNLAYKISPDSTSLHYRLSSLDPEWRATPPLPHPGTLPIVAAVGNSPNGVHKLVVAGGLGLGLASKETLSTVDLYDSLSDTWTPCADLPEGFATSRSVTAVVCDGKLFLFHIYSGIVASLDVVTRRWSKVTTLRPPWVEPGLLQQYCYLAAWRGALLLVGVSNENDRFFFRGWEVAAGSMECAGPSWPVLCHFAGVKASGNNKWKTKESVAEVSELCVDRPLGDHYFVAVLNFLSRRFSFCAGVLGFFDALLEFSKAIS